MIVFLTNLIFLIRPYDEGGKRTFFLVNTKTLVDQQGSVIEQMTDLKVGRYTGDLNVDFWDKSKWLEELRKHQVRFCFLIFLISSNT